MDMSTSLRNSDRGVFRTYPFTREESGEEAEADVKGWKVSRPNFNSQKGELALTCSCLCILNCRPESTYLFNPKDEKKVKDTLAKCSLPIVNKIPALFL